MRNLFLILLFIPLFAFTQNVSFNEWAEGKSFDLIEGVEDYSSTELPFHVKVKKSTSEDSIYIYKEGGNVIAFKPIGLKLSEADIYHSHLKIKKAKKGDGLTNIKHDSIFTAGSSIEIESHQRGMRKVLKFDSYESTGLFQGDIGYLDITFQVFTDYDIYYNDTLWDGTSTVKFTNDLRLGSKSYLKAIKVWNADTTIYCDGYLFSKSGNPDKKNYINKHIPIETLKSMSYPIYTDLEIGYGWTAVVHNDGLSTVTAIDGVTDSTFCFMYIDQTSDDLFYQMGKLVTGVVNADSIAYGSAVEVEATLKYPVVRSYNSEDGWALSESGGSVILIRHLEFSDITVTVGGTASVTEGGLLNNDIVGFHEDSALAVIEDQVLVVSWNGSVTSEGTNYTWGVANEYLSVDRINDSVFVAIYNDVAATEGRLIGFKRIAEVVTWGTEVVFDPADSFWNEIKATSDNKFACFYSDAGASDTMRMFTGEVDLTDLTITVNTIYSTGEIGIECSMDNLDENVFIDTYQGASNGESIVATLNGTVFTFGSSAEFYSADDVSGTSVGAVTINKFVNFYVADDSGNQEQVTGTRNPLANRTWNGTAIVKFNGTAVSKINGIE